jgi:hypothetical protein
MAVFSDGEYRGVRMLLRSMLVSALCVGASACGTHAYLPVDGRLQTPAASPLELSMVSGTAATPSFHRPTQLPGLNAGDQAAGLASSEARSWFGRPGTDYQVEIANAAVGKETGWWTLVLYIGTLGALPLVVDQEYESTLVFRDSAGSEIFRNNERYRMRGAISILPTALFVGTPGHGAANRGTQDQMNRHKLALGAHMAQSRGEYEQAVAAATVEAYRSYLKENPASFYRRETLARLSALAPAQNPLRFHIDNMAIASDYLPFVPADQAIWFVGPAGLRVHDVLTESRRQNEALLAARIRTGGAPYKVFNSEEVARLQSSGIKPGLIAAMMEVSAAAPTPTPAVNVVAPAGQPASIMFAPAAAAPAANVEADKPDAGDIAAQCAKRFAAMKACDQVPSLGRNLCKAQVNRTYDHIACAVIQ